MQRLMKLRVRASACGKDKFNVFSQQYDGTPFNFITDKRNITLTDIHESEGVRAWLNVMLIGRQDDRCHVELPDPTLHFGKHVTVHDEHLTPMGV